MVPIKLIRVIVSRIDFDEPTKGSRFRVCLTLKPEVPRKVDYLRFPLFLRIRVFIDI